MKLHVSLHNVYYTCTPHALYSLDKLSTQVQCTHVHSCPASHFFLCRESESIFLVNSLFATTVLLPPTTFSNGAARCVPCIFSPLFTSQCGLWAEKGAVKPTCHQWTTSGQLVVNQWATNGQPMGAKRVTHCIIRVPRPPMYQSGISLQCSLV